MVCLRLAVGMRRRTERKNFSEHNTIMRKVLEQQLESGQTSLYGQRLTYQRIRQCGIPVGRDRMFEILRTIDPVGVSERIFGMQKIPRGIFSVPGINFVLSVDGHHKMCEYGIEVYAGIDAYSRLVSDFFYSI